MTTITKFQFDTEFDVRPKHAPQPAIEPEPPLTFSEAELEHAEQEAFVRGRETGLAEASAAVERKAAAAQAAIATALEAAAPSRAAAWDACRNDALVLAGTVAAKLVPQLLRRDALAAVESLVTELMPQLIEEPRLVIRVNSALLDPLKERVDAVAGAAGYHGQIILLGEDRMLETDCRIEWADGGAERDTQRLMGEIETTVERFVRGVAEQGLPAATTEVALTEEILHG